MPIVLNVAEKPSVAREVSRILNNGTMPQGQMLHGARYNPVYSFGCTIQQTACQMRFTSITGHLLDSDFGPAWRGWRSCAEGDLIDPQKAQIVTGIRRDCEALEVLLKAEARGAQWLILWLDCDREGEAICQEARTAHAARHVMDVCRSTNSRLRVLRARFSALTPAEVWRAVGTHLGQPDGAAAAAVKLRQEIDLRLGAAFTRFQTQALQDAFDFGEFAREEGKGPMISYGPCQFPTLGFIVQRHWEAQAHMAETTWTVQVSHTAPDGRRAEFNWKRGRLYDQRAAAVLYEICCAAPTVTICDVSGSLKKRWAPVPLNTLEMQKRTCSKLRQSPEQIMKLAEELYQNGFISYPRTETDSFPPELDLREIVDDQAQDARWGPYAQQLLQSGSMRLPRAGPHNDNAHPPIYPTKYSAGENSWCAAKASLYEFIVRHFLACVSPDAAGDHTLVTALLAAETFTATGLMIREMGYLAVYGAGPATPGGPRFNLAYDFWGGGGNSLPAYRAGESFAPSSLTLEAGRTRAPELLTETELLTLMDRHGIGTDATQAAHISKVCNDRGYARKQPDGRLEPTLFGEALVAAYDRVGMKHMWMPSLRAGMEADCDAVAKGTLQRDVALQRCLGAMKSEFHAFERKVGEVRATFAHFFPRKAGGGGGGLMGGVAAFGGPGTGGGRGGPPFGGGGGGNGGPPGPPRGPTRQLTLFGERAPAPAPAGRGTGRGATGARGAGGGAKRRAAEAAEPDDWGGQQQAPAPQQRNVRARGEGAAMGRGRGRGAAVRGRAGASAGAGRAAAGRGGADGGGGNNCFKCGQPGHWSNSCPNAAAGGGGGGGGRGGGRSAGGRGFGGGGGRFGNAGPAPF